MEHLGHLNPSISQLRRGSWFAGWLLHMSLASDGRARERLPATAAGRSAAEPVATPKRAELVARLRCKSK
jgi:hypothetical protein